MATAAKATTDHDVIRQWVEARGGCPAHVKGTGRRRNDPGILRIDYSGFSGEDTLEEIGWDTWFDAFDRNRLAFLYQPRGRSRFSKLVERDTIEAKPEKSRTRSSTKASASTSRRSSSSGSKQTSAKASPSRSKESSRASRSSSAGENRREKGGAALATVDHDEIRRWVEARGGSPAHVKATGRKRNDPGILRIDYPGFSGEATLEEMDWDDWFQAFDQHHLAFLYQPKGQSRFSKLVDRDSVESKLRSSGTRRTTKASASSRKPTSRAASRSGATSATRAKAATSRASRRSKSSRSTTARSGH